MRKKRMNLNCRTLIALVAVTLLIGGVIGGTLAWLTAVPASVTNTFTTSTIDIELTESPNLDLKMVPGCTITKDPKATVEANSEHCWLFVAVEQSMNYTEYLEDYSVADGWAEVNNATASEYIRIFAREVDSSTEAQDYFVLAGNQVKVLDSVTKAQMDAISDEDGAKPMLNFTAYAIQYEGFNTAIEAWKALDPYNEFADPTTYVCDPRKRDYINRSSLHQN